MNKKYKELSNTQIKKIGIYTTIFFIIFFGLIIFHYKNAIFKKYYTVKVLFNFIGNLKPGCDVKFISGPKVGYVKKIERYKNKVKVILKIDKNFKLRERSEFSIFTYGLMGEKYIEIFQTPNSGKFVKERHTFIGNDAISFEIFQQNMARIVKDIDIFESQKKLNNLNIIIKKVLDNLNYFSKNIKGIRTDVKFSTEKLKNSTQVSLSNINYIIPYLEKFNTNLKTIKKEDVKKIFLSIDEYQNQLKSLNSMITNLLISLSTYNYQFTKLTNKKTTEWKLIFDKKYYKKLRKDLKKIERYTHKIAKDPSKLLFK